MRFSSAIESLLPGGVRGLVEVGAYFPRYSFGAAWAREHPESTVDLWEPQPYPAAVLRQSTAALVNVTVNEAAIGPWRRTVMLRRPEQVTPWAHVAGYGFPEYVPPETAAPFVVDCVSPEDAFHHRRYRVPMDVMVLDVEGAEWLVLRGLRVYPAVLFLELRAHEFFGREHPDRAAIEWWLRDNDYREVAHNVNRQDVVFAKRGVRDA